jgi:hypothetical protein
MAGKTYIKTGIFTWRRVKKVYLKTGASTWVAIRKAYLKTGSSTWRKVYDTASNAPFIVGNDIPKIRLNTFRTDSTSPGAVNPVVAAPPVQFIGPRNNGVQGSATPSPTDGYLGDNGIGSFLWGYDGTWSTTTGVTFTYDWFWADNPDGNTTSDYTPNVYSGRDDKISNVADNTGWLVASEPDGAWLYFRVKAASAGGNGQAISTPVKLIRQEPKITTFSMLTPASSSLNTPKFISTSISNLWYNAAHFYESKVEWFSESSDVSPLLNSSTLVKTEFLNSFASSRTEADGTTITQQPSYTPVNVNSKGYSDSDKYIYARLTLINSYTKHLNSPVTILTNTTVPVGQIRTYTPQWGENIFVSTNGYIGLQGSTGISSINDTGTQGHVVSFLNRDLKQNSLRYWADGSKYIVDWAGRLYDAESTTVTYRYQAHFYPGQNYVDFYVINNAGGTSGNAYLYNGQQQVPWGASKPTGSAYRINLTSGVAFQTIAYNPRSTATGFTSVTTMDGADDAVTTLVLTQGISVPENSASPQFQLLSGNANKVGSRYRLTSGSWLNSPTEYNYYITRNDINGTQIANSGWTTSTNFDYTFTATTTQTVSGFVVARNAGGESIPAFATSIGPIETDFTPPTPTGVTFNGTSFIITFSGGAGPYYQLWWERGSAPTAPSASTNYDASGLLPTSAPFSITYTPSGTSSGEIWNFWLRSASSATASTTGVDRGVYSSNYVSVTITGPANFSISIFDSTTTPNQPSLTTSYTSPNVNIDWADDATATGGWQSSISGGTQGSRTNTRFVSNDFWSVTEGSSYSGSVYAINTSKSVTMSWGNVSGAQSYRLAYDIDGGTTQVIDKGSATSHTVFTSGAVRVLGIVAYANSNYTGASTSGSYDSLLFVTPTNKNSATSTYSITIPVTPIIPTVTIAANSGVGTTAGTINWTSTNQASYSVSGTFAVAETASTTARSVSKTGLTQSTTYTGTITVKSSTGNSATANYSLRTSDPATNYTITYNGNQNTGGSMLNTVGNGSVTLRANGFTRTNCTFAGWATSSTGSVVYANNAAYTLSADATLYAKWNAATNSATAPTVSFTGTSGTSPNIVRSWSWTTGSVTGGTATGYEWQISSTNSTSGYGDWTFTTARTLSRNANTPRWLRVRKVYTDGLGVTKRGDFNSTGV